MEGDVDFLKEGVRALSQAIMEMEVEEHLGARRYERSPGRTGQRNGYRTRSWDTRVGTTIELSIPRVRDSRLLSFAIGAEGRRAERALFAVVQEAYYMHGGSQPVRGLAQKVGIRY
jgi:transposase-like protein